MPRAVKVFLLATAVVVVVVAFGAVAVLLLSRAMTTPSVPLTADLQGRTWDEISHAFDQRVKRRFPIGSSEKAMAEELQIEEFVRNDWVYVMASKKEAFALRRETRIPCGYEIYVYWRADASGHLTSIRGEYSEAGCL